MRAFRLGIAAGVALLCLALGSYVFSATWAARPEGRDVALGLAWAFFPIAIFIAIVSVAFVLFEAEDGFRHLAGRAHEIRKSADARMRALRGDPPPPIDGERGFSSSRDPNRVSSLIYPFVIILAFAGGIAAVVSTVPSVATADSFEASGQAEFWRVATGQYDRTVARSERAFAPRATGEKAEVAKILVAEANRQGVPARTALKLAWVESRLACHKVGPATRHGRARGVLQVIPASAERLEPGSYARLRDCATGARVGVAHMRDCIAAGARTDDEIARCHVGGKGALRTRLRAGAETYARWYVSAFRAAPVFAVPDRSGWLERGSVSVASLVGG